MDEQFKEKLKEFVRWLKLKVRIHVSDKTTLSYKQREVWWVNVGLNVGSEQNGKNDNFERPVLVLRKFGHNIFWAIPLTSKDKDNIYNHKVIYKKYFEDATGKLQKEEKGGFVILNQLKTMSSKRLIRKTGVMPESEFDIVKERIKKML